MKETQFQTSRGNWLTPKNILVLNFFPAFVPPSSGGELRYFNLYQKLSGEFDVTLLSPTYADQDHEVVEHSASYREYRVPKEHIHGVLHERIDQERIAQEASALVCALSARYPNNYHRFFLQLYQKADIIIHESPYMLEYDLFFGVDRKPRVYNSYNVESSLVEQMWSGEHAEKYIGFIRSLEQRLVTNCDLCFAVSIEEKQHFIQIFNADSRKFAIAPNGINPSDFQEPEYIRANRVRPKALFFGSFHPPNLTAVEFIIHELADKCPDIDFTIAGNCGKNFKSHEKHNISVLGKVSDKVKHDLFKTADIAINPMFSGAGTNIKVLEYLSSGIPLVSTEIGVRGLNLVPNEHYTSAGREDFAAKLCSLLKDPALQNEISQRAKSEIEKRFSWESIAREFSDNLRSAFQHEKTTRKKIIFLLNDFAVDCPRSGGEIRLNRIYSALSKSYTVVLLCLNNTQFININYITPTFVQISAPKTEDHLACEKEINSQFSVSANDIITSLSISKNDFVQSLAFELYHIADVIILSHPYMVDALPELDIKPIIYESLNCEYELKKQILCGHTKYSELVIEAKRCESKAIERSRLVISVSEYDHQSLCSLTRDRKPVYCIQNGVDIIDRLPDRKALAHLLRHFQGYPIATFIGSAHRPNVEGGLFIMDQLACSMPDCFFLIIGGVCETLRYPPSNVVLCGVVDEEPKSILLRMANVALNPITSGSGSNLKLAEYMAHQLPIVTTSFGARGYNIRNGEQAIVCELPEFKEQLDVLLKDPDLQKSLAEKGHHYVRSHHDWNVLASQFDSILDKECFQQNRKRLLIVTYRFTEPPLGGAEVHLLELIRQLDQADCFDIDVACLDIIEITNKFHFSMNYNLDAHFPVPKGLRRTKVHRFRTDRLPEKTALENARELFRNWMEEFRDSSLRLKDFCEFPILLGGWYYPEHVEGRFEIWSSDEALIFVQGVEHIIIEGYCPRNTRVTFTADQETLRQDSVSGNFKIEFPVVGHQVLRLNIDRSLNVENDPRSLGVRVKSIKYRVNDELLQLELDYNYRDFMKQYHPGSYVDELIHIASNRSRQIDELFQTTRGPLSTELAAWLETHASEYDMIWGHGVPFSTSIMAAEVAEKHSKPSILMPHYHIDDEFYHWQSYYDAMRKYDDIICFPRASKQLFFEKIGCKSTYLPYGIHLDEVPSLDDELRFRGLYKSDLPYVLVLGRKDGPKNYQSVINAMRNVNSGGNICNLVMIGRDEDGVPINSQDAYYLGGQPRNIVVAALRNCLCLVSMSESESFGIVILEAWSQRRPVIVNKHCTASTELVEDGIDGLHAGKGDLHEKILYLLATPSLADEMGKKGYEKVQREFTWKSISERLLGLFGRLSNSEYEDNRHLNQSIVKPNAKPMNGDHRFSW